MLRARVRRRLILRLDGDASRLLRRRLRRRRRGGEFARAALAGEMPMPTRPFAAWSTGSTNALSAVSNARTNLCRLGWFASPDVFIAWYPRSSHLANLASRSFCAAGARRLHLFRDGGEEIARNTATCCTARSTAQPRARPRPMDDPFLARSFVSSFAFASSSSSSSSSRWSASFFSAAAARIPRRVVGKLPQEVQPRAKFADG